MGVLKQATDEGRRHHEEAMTALRALIGRG